MDRTGRRLYRIVTTDPPSRDDFLSQLARGRVVERPDPYLEDLARGVSVLSSEEAAQAVARRYPRLGSFIAELAVPEGTRLERTGNRAGHFTIWAEPDVLLRTVVRVRAVG